MGAFVCQGCDRLLESREHGYTKLGLCWDCGMCEWCDDEAEEEFMPFCSKECRDEAEKSIDTNQ